VVRDRRIKWTRTSDVGQAKLGNNSTRIPPTSSPLHQGHWYHLQSQHATMSGLSRRGTRQLLLNSTAARQFSSCGRRRGAAADPYSHLQTALPQRQFPLLYDALTPTQSHKLLVSLASQVPESWVPDLVPLSTPALSSASLSTLSAGMSSTSTQAPALLPPAFHLVHFNPALPAAKLLPDGTDPNQSPGEPFTRRMWAGGSLRFNHGAAVAPMRLDGGPAVCVEGIRDVTIKGGAGEEKIFVGIERRMAAVADGTESDASIRQRLWAEDEEDLAQAAVVERRNIVFMRERTPAEVQAALDLAKSKEARVEDSRKCKLLPPG
jgi:hypothetical protein